MYFTREPGQHEEKDVNNARDGNAGVLVASSWWRVVLPEKSRAAPTMECMVRGCEFSTRNEHARCTLVAFGSTNGLPPALLKEHAPGTGACTYLDYGCLCSNPNRHRGDGAVGAEMGQLRPVAGRRRPLGFRNDIGSSSNLGRIVRLHETKWNKSLVTQDSMRRGRISPGHTF